MREGSEKVSLSQSSQSPLWDWDRSAWIVKAAQRRQSLWGALEAFAGFEAERARPDGLSHWVDSGV